MADPFDRETLREEQVHFTEVYEQIHARRLRVEAEHGRVSQELRDLLRTFWEDFRWQEDSIDRRVEINQEQMLLSHKNDQYGNTARLSHLLDRMERTPYFGRLDFREAEPAAGPIESLYIGLGSFTADDGTALVYDWRAPVSSLYYEGVLGPVSYRAPAGEIRGELCLKRQYWVSQGRLEGFADLDLPVGDELLLHALSRHAGPVLRSTVATIQAEQNRAIRADGKGILVVTGPAGSGKTSVALQRVAYLLYRNRDVFGADRVLFFSPSALFKSYVARVLPDLGEEALAQTTFAEFLDHAFAGDITVEDPSVAMEDLLSLGDSQGSADRRWAAAHRRSPAFVRAIERYAASLDAASLPFRSASLGDRTIASEDDLRAEVARLPAGSGLPARMHLLREHLEQKVERTLRHAGQQSWVRDAMDLLDADAYQAVHERITSAGRELAAEGYYQAAERDLAKTAASPGVKPLRAWLQNLHFVDTPRLYARFLRQMDAPAHDGSVSDTAWSDSVAATIGRLGQGVLPWEDALPCMLLTATVKGLPKNHRIRHVLIDEAQDMTLGQVTLVRRLFPMASLTLFGDPDQRTAPGPSALDDPEALAIPDASEDVTVLHLTHSYRPTREIAEFTRALTDHARSIATVPRTGPRPTVTEVSDAEALHKALERRLRDLRGQGQVTIAVLTKTAQEAEGVANGLRSTLPVRVITRSSEILADGIQVLPASLAKGVEFDAVLVANASDERFRAPQDRQLLYVAATRALHRLDFFSIGPVSRFLAQSGGT